MELEETSKMWKQKTHILQYFKKEEFGKPKDFMSKFYEGYDWICQNGAVVTLCYILVCIYNCII